MSFNNTESPKNCGQRVSVLKEKLTKLLYYITMLPIENQATAYQPER
jgi:hypothetical protein